jgi:hypothetical protein
LAFRDCLNWRRTMLFSGDSKSWLSAFNRQQNAATIFGRLLPNLMRDVEQ